MGTGSGISVVDQDRYQRQTILPEIGASGQKKLSQASVLIVGLGGLGCPAALYLAAAGVGKLGLVDPDCVALSNLHRQILYNVEDIDRQKVEVAESRLRRYNPELEVVKLNQAFDESFEPGLFKTFDLVIDATDNFQARYAINELCRRYDIPFVYGALHRYEGQVSVFAGAGKDSPCYNCFFPEKTNTYAVPDCASAGVIGILPGIIGTMQAMEGIKVLLETLGEPLKGKLLIYDALDHKTRVLAMEKDPSCRICRGESRISKMSSSSCNLEGTSISVEELTRLIDPPDKRGKDIELIDVRRHEEHLLDRIPDSICIPLSELEDWLDEHSSRESCYVIYCQSGARSLKALNLMLSKGYKNVRSLTGGLSAWQRR